MLCNSSANSNPSGWLVCWLAGCLGQAGWMLLLLLLWLWLWLWLLLLLFPGPAPALAAALVFGLGCLLCLRKQLK